MKLWHKIKLFFKHRVEMAARMEVYDFLVDGKTYEYYPYLKNLDDRLAYKKKLTETYTYQPDDDLLAKKQDFIEQYTINEKEQFDCFITKDPFDHSDEIKTHAWRNHEQVERREAQKNWRKVVRRNYHEHLSKLFTADQNQRQ